MEELISTAVGMATCAAATYTDLKFRKIPDYLWLVNVLTAVVVYRLKLFTNGHFLWALSTFVFLLVLSIMLDAFGGGDVKFIPSVILLSGQLGIVAIAVGVGIEIAYGYYLSLRTGSNLWKIKLPLAPFLALGYIFSIITRKFIL